MLEASYKCEMGVCGGQNNVKQELRYQKPELCSGSSSLVILQFIKMLFSIFSDAANFCTNSMTSIIDFEASGWMVYIAILSPCDVVDSLIKMES